MQSQTVHIDSLSPKRAAIAP
jgi:hypothetical protein